LAKADVENFEDVLSESGQEKLSNQSTRVVEAAGFGDGARLYVFVGQDTPPKWLLELRRTFDIAGRIETKSTCGLLVFRTAERMFAATFAHGWMYLNEENFEGDFGLRVAINAVDEGKLKRLDRANLGDALRGAAVSPFQRDFNSFGLDDALDLVRKIGGGTRLDATADNITGSQSLKVSGDFSLEDLPEIATEALDFFGSDAYQQTSFRILDSVTPISDPRLVSVLDNIAVGSIRNRQDEFELGLPVNYGDEGVAYRFIGPGMRRRYPDVLLRNYIEALADDLGMLQLETIKEHKIEALYEDGNLPNRRWSIRQGLVGSIVHEEARYAINEGQWYRIDQIFRDSIETSFQNLLENWEIAPIPLRKVYDDNNNGRYQTEESFNEETALANGYVLLDQTSIQIPDVPRSGFEPCDLLDIPGKRFIHVKKSSRRSNVLSHFFKQGANSAQQFKRFPAAWPQLQQLVTQISGNEIAGALQLAIDDIARPWTIEFRIADAPRQNGEFNIPFFSKISLRDEVINLTAMDYRVVVKFIGLQPEVI
jgi:uncharacterized protein (TIGR04141 family)